MRDPLVTLEPPVDQPPSKRVRERIRGARRRRARVAHVQTFAPWQMYIVECATRRRANRFVPVRVGAGILTRARFKCVRHAIRLAFFCRSFPLPLDAYLPRGEEV